MLRSVTLLSIGVMFVSSLSAAQAIEVPLEFVLYEGDPDSLIPATAFLGEKLSPPAGEWILPEFNAEKPKYFTRGIGETLRLFVRDQRDAGDIFYTRLFIDLNENRDLTDDGFLDGTIVEDKERRRISVVFPKTKLTVTAEGGPFHYGIQPIATTTLPPGFYEAGTDKKRAALEFKMTYKLCGTYQGGFRHDGQEFRVVLADATFNGRFDDTFDLTKVPSQLRYSAFAAGDLFFLTQEGAAFDYHDRFVLGRWLCIGDSLFRVRVDMGRKTLSLIAVKEGLSPLVLEKQPERLTLLLHDSDTNINLYRPGRMTCLPTGTYGIYAYELLKREPSGDLWRLNARGSADCPKVILDGDSETVLDLGEPYTAVIEVSYKGPPRKSSLILGIKGKAEERVEELQRIEGDKTPIEMSDAPAYPNRPKEPSYRLTKADGEIVAQGTFEYG